MQCSRGLAPEEKTRIEAKISELEDELLDEQSNGEQLNDRVRRLSAQVRQRHVLLGHVIDCKACIECRLL